VKGWARRIDALDRVVEGPHPSRNPKPVRRVEAELRIVDDGAMLEARIGHDALDAGCLVGDPAAGRELAGRERGGHGDEPDLPARAAGPARAVEINLACHQGHVATVEQRGRGHLAGVDRAAAAERDQRIGADPLGLGHEGPHRTCGHMLPDAREHAGAVRAHRRRDALEERRGAQGLAGRDQRARRAHPLELGSERRDLAGAERDSFEPCEGELEVRRIDTDGFGSSRIEGRGHGSLSVHPEDQVRSWGRAFG
jgi:hypothetical protein